MPLMRRYLFVWSLLILVGVPVSMGAAQAKIKKVLPHFLDAQGRHTLSPSLYERDAYQAHLRSHPEEQSGLRFSLLFKSSPSTNLVVRMDLRGSRENQPTTQSVQSSPFRHKGGREWKSVTLEGKAFQEFGEVMAWRATLWQGNRLLAEQRSFLW